jgi:PAS domain S-box-containing protein
MDEANRTKIILESISDGVFTIDLDWKVTSFNRGAEEITGIPRHQALGRHCWEVFRSNMCDDDCALKRTMAQDKAVVSSATHIIRSDKQQIPITVSTSLLKNSRGKILGGVETFRAHSLEQAHGKERSARFQLDDIVSASPGMQRLFTILPQISESDSTVLITGETGTGTELIARAIHHLSHRRAAPFVAVNCGALPDSLLESELFGYKAGAFTNAVKDKPGLFSAATHGTLLLDEIAETSAAFQVKLLRVLEKRGFRPLGAIKNEPMDVRIIAATNKDLAAMVKANRFRENLFYRINVVELALPPLRNRMENLLLLADHFITKLNRLRGKTIQGVDPAVMKILMSHSFPGNIRELENIIEHASVLCLKGTIQPCHLPPALAATASDPKPPSTTDPVKSAETALLMDALKQTNCNRTAAAKILGMHKSTFFRKIHRLGITLPARDGRSSQPSPDPEGRKSATL